MFLPPLKLRMVCAREIFGRKLGGHMRGPKVSRIEIASPFHQSVFSRSNSPKTLGISCWKNGGSVFPPHTPCSPLESGSNSLRNPLGERGPNVSCRGKLPPPFCLGSAKAKRSTKFRRGATFFGVTLPSHTNGASPPIKKGFFPKT